MPRGDGTGPVGMGPRTGRAAGLCAGYPVPGYANPLPGTGAGWYGRGGGRMGGRGHRHWYYATGLTGRQRAAVGWPASPAPLPAYPYAAPYAPLSAEEEAKAIRNQIDMMEESIRAARERLEEIEKEQKEES